MIVNQLERMPHLGQHDCPGYIDVILGGGIDGLMARAEI